MQNCRLDDLISSNSDNKKLVDALSIIQPRSITESLSEFDSFELYQFMQVFCQNVDETITGSENFPGKMLTPRKNRISLPDDIYELLVKYYNDSYDDWNFVSIAELATSSDLSSNEQIVILPVVNQFGRVQITTEIFGSTLASRYQRSSNILAKFIDKNDAVDIYPGRVQFYFEHLVEFPNGTKKIHQLAFVKWYMFAPNQQTRFHCRIGNIDDNSCNIELWKYEFHELSRDSIIPIHNIYSRFISSKFTVGTRNPTTYMAVIPINRRFHL